MKKIASIILAVLAPIMFATGGAFADTTTSIPGTNCSVTAFTPYNAGGGSFIYTSGVSCAGGGGSKWVQDCAQVQNGAAWYTISGSCFNSGWVGSNPDRIAGDISGTSGHVYRTYAVGQVDINNSVSGAEAYSSGFQMP